MLWYLGQAGQVVGDGNMVVKMGAQGGAAYFGRQNDWDAAPKQMVFIYEDGASPAEAEKLTCHRSKPISHNQKQDATMIKAQRSVRALATLVFSHWSYLQFLLSPSLSQTTVYADVLQPQYRLSSFH